ncbi:adenosylmethionine--8-amino-7-oxononanoate transaminase [Desulfovibrio mangrovi]|uniref:adenosylmethionine--8-amino-7-oxononanoate transaminase n=1 Tax=Desulfovibrio mangrovi TaxID=2976983 RepID=UPI002246FC31|nr:adenosylmethionine--8-amino-7-oxononanoate transaminase [Desulfovibrio mangrovi]UZP66734.1 adenosylmethionine--8-amino-7-oxononanoate transaminase [Desulfovibrio mangrovi]
MTMQESPRTAALREQDKHHLWHPFTQQADWTQTDPLIIERGEGNWLMDTDGNRYLDGVSSLWTNVHGHRRPELDAALAEQLGKIAHSTLLGLGSVPSIELAARLINIAPQGLTRVFYSDSGSTAVEIALKLAFQFCLQNGAAERSKFASMRNAYHGDTIGSVSVGGMDLFHATYRAMLFESVKVESPYCYRCPFGQEQGHCDNQCFDHVTGVMEHHGHELAAFVIEPLVQGAAGQITHPSGYLQHVRELCDRHGVLLIADEVAVGFGKTGTMFACEQEDVSPDLLCLAKGISAGYLPLAATLTTERLYEGFFGRHEDFRTFFHGHTFTGNPLACSVAIRSLDLFTEDNLLEHVRSIAAHLTDCLAPLAGHPHVGDIRQRGIMIGIELVADRTDKAAFGIADRVGHRVCMAARKHGVIIRNLGDVIVLMPPLSVTHEEITLLCNAVGQAIAEVTEQQS